LQARETIRGQPADRLEERRAERVVQVFRLELLRRQREIALHVGREVSCEPFGTLRKHTDSSLETSSGSWGGSAREPWRARRPSSRNGGRPRKSARNPGTHGARWSRRRQPTTRAA